MKVIENGITAAKGFQAAGIAAGIKKGNKKDRQWCTVKNPVKQLEPLPQM